MVAFVGETIGESVTGIWPQRQMSRCAAIGEIVSKNGGFGPRFHLCVTVKNVTLPKKNQTLSPRANVAL